MARLKVKARDFSEDALYSRKKVKLGSKSFETPSKALDVEKTTNNDQVLDSARGLNEIWVTANSEKLRKARENFQDNFSKSLRYALNKTKNDEFNVVFINYNKAEKISKKNLEYMADVLYSSSDFITTPVMNDFYKAIKESNRGTDSRWWEIYKENTIRFLDIVEERNGKPIMAVLPYLPWDFTVDLIEEFLDRNICAFAFDFNAREVTATTQISDMVSPMMREVAQKKLREDSFFYCLNANPGRSYGEYDFTPSKDYLSLGVGFDVLGGKHTRIPMSKEVLEKMSDDSWNVKLFQKDDYFYQDYEVQSNISDKIPETTALDKKRIVKNLKKAKRYKYRYQRLLNAEQQSLENKNLRTVIKEERIMSHLDGKTGVTERQLDTLETARSKFDVGKGQQKLGEPNFWD